MRTPLASAGGYLPRMAAAYGPIFLGQDAGDGRYEAEAPPALAALASLSPCDTYVMALDATQHALQHRIDEARASALQDEAIRRHLCATPCDPVDWERVVDLRELVDALLAHFCEQWFGLSEEGGHFARGGYSWRWQPGEPARYPGHFIAPSRWFFQPHPGAEVGRIGAAHGQALRQAMDGFLAQFGSTLSQPSVTAVLGSSAAERDPGYASRTLLGLIMGFVPTVDAVLRRVLAQWWTDGTLWALRDARERLSPADLERHVDEAFRQAMQLRTVPELIWRTARDHGRLGGADGVDLVPGDVVVIGLASATQQALAAGSSAELGPATPARAARSRSR
ncbi:hypothetical protein ABXN37_18680 [Piscinibacter sakaiensis]|uniref:hypothetical protein n=1 Tax=Piscinibacter sakaiensis TaxID=1547922 RepID=UPI00372BCB92